MLNLLYSGFMAIVLVTIGTRGFYALITYLVFAVPLQFASAAEKKSQKKV
ncbi:UPF0715 family protein [Bacillus halotolerans]